MRLALAVTLVITLAQPADAQPNCRKGKPCGNSCIAQNRTCRVGGASSGSSTAEGSEPNAPSRAAPLYTPSDADRRQRTERSDTLMPWVAAMSPSVYFASACSGAATISADRRLFFRTEENLQRIGYKRASAKLEGCTLEQLQEHERRLSMSTGAR